MIKRMNKRNLISTLIAIALLLVSCIFVQGGSSLLWTKILSKILIFSIAALALNVVCGCLGEFALGHGGFLLIGYTVAVLVASFTKEMIGSGVYRELVYTPSKGLLPLGYLLLTSDVLVAAVATGVIGFVVGIIALGRLKGDYLAIVTLGVSLIFVNITKNIPALGGAQGIDVNIDLGGSPLIYGLLLVVCIFLILTFMKSRFGRATLACRDDNIAAEACGVPVNKTKVITFTFSALIAGLAGALYAHFNAFKPIEFGQDLSIELLIIVVLGGLGSLTGTVISSCIIVIYNLWFCTRSWVPPFFKSNPKIIYGIILVAIMLFRSSGILGTAEFTWEWFYSQLKKLKNKIFKHKTPKEVEN